VQLYRVFPHRPAARAGQPGHASYIHPDQGSGRWDNPDLYRAAYLATSPEGAIGETFADVATWRAAMVPFPMLDGARRSLGTYRLDEEAHPLIDLDDARTLLERGMRPSRVVWRNRPATQAFARSVYEEGRWSGLSWWSMHRPQWTLVCLWDTAALELEAVDPLPGHPALAEAAARLSKPVDDDLL
jgi:RES domain-containing protein